MFSPILSVLVLCVIENNNSSTSMRVPALISFSANTPCPFPGTGLIAYMSESLCICLAVGRARYAKVHRKPKTPAVSSSVGFWFKIEEKPWSWNSAGEMQNVNKTESLKSGNF